MIPRNFAVVKKQRGTGMIMTILASFSDGDAAQKWADNANEWYGELHPLTPLEVVGDILVEPKLFPVAAQKAGDIKAMFDTLGDD